MGLHDIQKPSSIKGAGSGSITATNRIVKIMDIATITSMAYLKVSSAGIPNLEHFKDEMRTEQKDGTKDYGVKGHLIPNYADANVRSSVITCVHTAQVVKLPNDEIQKHKLHVIDVKGLAMIGNPQAMRWAIAQAKKESKPNKELIETMQKNYEFFMAQPRRESYYSSK